MSYVDGYVLVVPKEKLDAYRTMAKKAGKVWLEHGALEYRECAGDDLHIEGVLSFTKPFKAKENETIVFAWIVYKSRAHRDQVNKKVMADQRMHSMCDPKNPPFDMKRMAFGGFKSIVALP